MTKKLNAPHVIAWIQAGISIVALSVAIAGAFYVFGVAQGETKRGLASIEAEIKAVKMEIGAVEGRGTQRMGRIEDRLDAITLRVLR